MKKELKVQNVGKGVHVKASGTDDKGTIDITVKVHMDNKANVPIVQQAWADAAKSIETVNDVPEAILAVLGALQPHIEKLK